MSDDQPAGFDAVEVLEAQARARLEDLVSRREDLIQSHIQPLDREIHRYEEQLKLLTELKATFDPGPETARRDAVTDFDGFKPALQQTGPVMLEARAASSSTTVRPSSSSVRERIRTRVQQVLKERGEPVHINEIHAEFVKRGWPVPGLGKPVNITSHLTNAEGIYSPRRGFYALGDATATKNASTTKAARRRTKARRNSQKGTK